MASVKDIKKLEVFSNEVVKIEVTYDFAKDGGAVGALDLYEALEDCVLVNAYTKVKTACISSGAATLIVGVTGDTDGILASTAVASLTANAIFKKDAAADTIRIASGSKVLMTIGAFALTAGKVVVVLEVAKF